MEYLISIVDELFNQKYSVKNNHQIEFINIVNKKLNFTYCTIDLQEKRINMYLRGVNIKSLSLSDELVEYIKLKIC